MSSHLEITALYLLVIELTIWLMGSRILALVRTDPYFHPIEIIVLVCVLLYRRHTLKLKLPYRSVPIIFLCVSLSYQLLFVQFSGVNISRLLSSGFVAPLYEEVLYRVVLIDIVERRLPVALSGPACVLTSAFFFAIAHRNTVSSSEDMVVCVVSGLALAGRYMATGRNLLETFFIHVLHNLHVLFSYTSVPGHITPLKFYAIILLVSLSSLVGKQ